MPDRHGERGARGPGPVAAVHRIFITTALAGALIYTLFELREFWHGAGGGAAARAGVALLVSVGISLYLRSLRGLAAKLTPHD
jgi:hypothetical protein